jgi:NodT family efflux transporter outer membrane factor (OMF) lipoprotein
MLCEQANSEAGHSRLLSACRPLLFCAMLLVYGLFSSACSSLSQKELSLLGIGSRESFVNSPKRDSEESHAAVSAKDLRSWWRTFEEPELNRLLETAFANNTDVRIAIARLRQAQAQREQARASFWPSIGASGSISRTKRNIGTFTLGQGSSGPSSIISTTYGVSIPVQYEFDIWGRIRNEAQAATFAERASFAELQSVGLSTTAEIAEQFFLARELCQQLELLDSTIRSDVAFYELVLSRYRSGIGDALDVYQAAQSLSTRRAGRPDFVASLVSARNQLKILVGEYPEGNDVCDDKAFPKVGQGIGPDVPAELLLRRPDVSAALLRLRASDAQLSAAIKDWLPRLKISASGGYESLDFSDLFSPETLVWRILGESVFAIFDGGLRNSQIDFQRALMDEREAQYLQVVLKACAEVENALKQRETLIERLVLLEERKNAISRTLRLSTEQYLQGIRDYLPILLSQGTLYSVQSELLRARRELISNYIQTARALGGDWRFGEGGELQERKDEMRAPQPKIVSALIKKRAI